MAGSSTNFVLETLKADDTNVLRDLVAAMKLVAGGNSKVKAMVDKAEKVIGPARKDEKVTGTVTFQEPDLTLREWCEQLRALRDPSKIAIEPLEGVHFKRENGCYYRNTNKASWLIDEA